MFQSRYFEQLRELSYSFLLNRQTYDTYIMCPIIHLLHTHIQQLEGVYISWTHSTMPIRIQQTLVGYKIS